MHDRPKTPDPESHGEPDRDIVWSSGRVDRARREALLGQQGCVLWFTGLSGSGKSTLAEAVENELHELGVLTYRLDGDNLRHGLNRDLGFSADDRKENIRRVAEVAALFADAGLTVMTSCISPYAVDRQTARDIIGPDRFVEVYARASLAVCEQRDTKGLYAKARAGEIPDFTGISAPYEEPENADLVVDTGDRALQECVEATLIHMRQRGALSNK